MMPADARPAFVLVVGTRGTASQSWDARDMEELARYLVTARRKGKDTARAFAYALEPQSEGGGGHPRLMQRPLTPEETNELLAMAGTIAQEDQS